MCPLGDHRNSFVTTHALGHMMYCPDYGLELVIFGSKIMVPSHF